MTAFTITKEGRGSRLPERRRKGRRGALGEGVSFSTREEEAQDEVWEEEDVEESASGEVAVEEFIT